MHNYEHYCNNFEYQVGNLPKKHLKCYCCLAIIINKVLTSKAFYGYIVLVMFYKISQCHRSLHS